MKILNHYNCEHFICLLSVYLYSWQNLRDLNFFSVHEKSMKIKTVSGCGLPTYSL